MSTQLCDLQLKSKAKVIGIESDSKVRRRLMDMGIIRGTTVSIEGKAPFGDPIEIKVRGYNLTLRKSEAKDVLVEKI